MRGYRLAPFAVVGLGSLALLVLWGSPATAQTKAYGGRLSPVPITVAMQEAVAGRGSVNAVLSDNRLTIEAPSTACGRPRRLRGCMSRRAVFEGPRSPTSWCRAQRAAPSRLSCNYPMRSGRLSKNSAPFRFTVRRHRTAIYGVGSFPREVKR